MQFIFLGILPNTTFMRSRIRKKIITLLLLPLWVLMPQAGMGGMVLCIGGDGHVAVEPTHQSCDRSLRRADSVGVTAANINAIKTTPGNCTDLPLVSSQLVTVSKQETSTAQVKQIPLVVWILPDWRELFPIQSARSSFVFPPSRSSPDAFLRTVVLLV